MSRREWKDIEFHTVIAFTDDSGYIAFSDDSGYACAICDGRENRKIAFDNSAEEYSPTLICVECLKLMIDETISR